MRAPNSNCNFPTLDWTSQHKAFHFLGFFQRLDNLILKKKYEKISNLKLFDFSILPTTRMPIIQLNSEMKVKVQFSQP